MVACILCGARRRLVVLMVAMWGDVVDLVVGLGPGARLWTGWKDLSLPTPPRRVCWVALVDVSVFPLAVSAPDAVARAEIVTRANERFEQMLDDLAAQRPYGEEGEVVDAWLADWHNDLEDRAAYAQALGRIPMPACWSPPGTGAGERVHRRLRQGNGIPACATPFDVS